MLRISGRILRKVLSNLVENTKEGVSLRALDTLARELFRGTDAKPAFLGYRPAGSPNSYPAAICTSLNSTVVHGLPLKRVLKKGDVLKIDVGVNYKGFYTDAAITIGIGAISPRAQKLIKATSNALLNGISEAKPGNYIGDISYAIEKTARDSGFSVIHDLTGHGVGFYLHEEPNIPNFGRRGEGMRLEPGMVLAIEPMFGAGSGRIIQKADGSFAAQDGGLTAHFEHTVLITKKGNEILTSDAL